MVLLLSIDSICFNRFLFLMCRMFIVRKVKHELFHVVGSLQKLGGFVVIQCDLHGSSLHLRHHWTSKGQTLGSAEAATGLSLELC